MRSNEERVAAVKKRVKEEEQKKHRRQRTLLAVSCTAASILCIIAMAAVMPSAVEEAVSENYAVFGTTASIFGRSTTSGYVLIGTVSFVLGTAVGVLFCRIRERNRSEGKREKNEGI